MSSRASGTKPSASAEQKGFRQNIRQLRCHDFEEPDPPFVSRSRYAEHMQDLEGGNALQVGRTFVS